MGRRTAPAFVVATIVAALLAPIGAHATASQEDSFVQHINDERSSRGIRTVVVRSDLVEVARRWSAHMAQTQTVSHDPNIANEISGWTALGDNVGRGPDVDSLHQAFMNSPEHRSIILDPRYNQVGVGVVESNNTLYVTEIFVQRASSTVSRVTTRRYSAPSPSTRTIRKTSAGTYELALTGLVWELDLNGPPLTVSVLEQLVGLDAARVDPNTGNPRA